MKQILLIVGLVVLGAVGYWLLMGQTAVEESPATAVDTGDDAGNGTTEPVDSDEDYVGLTVAEAEVLAAENDVPFRVVERDGERLMVTEDWRPGRINAVVEGDVVVSYTVEGEESDASASDQADDTDKQGDPNANKYDYGDPVANDGSTNDADTNGEHDVIIGMTEAEAQAYAEANDVPFRIGAIDGEAMPVTMDYRPGRITASLEAGVVTGYTVE